MFRHGLGRRITAILAAVGLLCLNYTVEYSATIHQLDINGDGNPTYVHFTNGERVTLKAGQQITVHEPCTTESIGPYGFGWHQVPVNPKLHVKWHSFVAIREAPFSVATPSRSKRRDSLRALAVAAPFWEQHTEGPASRAIGSRTPFSLQNACRLAAGLAQSGEGAWGASNWNPDPSAHVVMYDYADDLGDFQKRLDSVRPNLLLVGAMTLGMPGAIEIARMAKATLGDSVTVVLGGKHASETVYRKQGDESVHHAPGSPLRVMLEGKAPEHFDVVVSGDGEHVVAKLGEMVTTYGNAACVKEHLSDLASCPGTWIAASIENGTIRTVASTGIPIAYDTMPVPAQVFGFSASFPVFGADRTAHVYSDISRGCIYDCFFCTERVSVNGKPRLDGSAERLARQLAVVRESGQARGDRVSAFVEDSILLMGKTSELERLHALLSESGPVPFGGQITIDLLLRPEVQAALQRLKGSGFCYLYAGMETSSEAVAKDMSKNIGKKGDWMERNERAVKVATDLGIKYGVSLLFGLGETQAERVHQLQEIARWQQAYQGNPCVVSLNWATQHPLFDVGTADYVEWGTPGNSGRLPLFQKLFGEASEKYTVTQLLPTVAELRELERIFDGLALEQ